MMIRTLLLLAVMTLCAGCNKWDYKDGSYLYENGTLVSLEGTVTDIDGNVYNTVHTEACSNITAIAATGGGTVTDGGGLSVTARGVCWSTAHNPTLASPHTTDGTGTGSFTSHLTGLASGTTYYVRAYATTAAGTAYGNEVSFTTLSVPAGDAQPCPGTPTVTDIDGNTYNTVQIGNQCWMKENLRTTHYADNTEIPAGSTRSDTDPYRYSPNGDASNVATYGYLYNWPAVMHRASSSNANPSGVQGICPTGWHVPSDAEWTQLTDYVSSIPAYWCGGSSGNIAKALAATTGWSGHSGDCTVGNDQSANNATGFRALPAGYYYYDSYHGFGGIAYFWSATEHDSDNVHYRFLFFDGPYVYRDYYFKDTGQSVRCLRDE